MTDITHLFGKLGSGLSRADMERLLGLPVTPDAKPTGTRPAQPIAVEREYARVLTAIAEVTGEAIRETLLEYVQSQVEGDGLEVDELEPGRLAEIVARLRRLADRVSRLDLSDDVARIALRILRWNATDQSAVLGIPVEEAAPGAVAALERWRAEQADLIASISTRQVERVAGIVGEAQRTGERVESLATRIGEELGIARRRAETIATDQVLTANARVTQERHRAAGVTRYEWSTSSDDRVRPEHERIDGRVFEWSSQGAPGAGIRGEPAHPGEAIRCRCVAIPVID